MGEVQAARGFARFGLTFFHRTVPGLRLFFIGVFARREDAVGDEIDVRTVFAGVDQAQDRGAVRSFFVVDREVGELARRFFFDFDQLALVQVSRLIFVRVRIFGQLRATREEDPFAVTAASRKYAGWGPCGSACLRCDLETSTVHAVAGPAHSSSLEAVGFSRT